MILYLEQLRSHFTVMFHFEYFTFTNVCFECLELKSIASLALGGGVVAAEHIYILFIFT